MTENLKGKNSCTECNKNYDDKKSCNSCDKDKNECSCNKGKNLQLCRVTQTNINSNVQYVADTDFFNVETINPWGIITLEKDNICRRNYWVANYGSFNLSNYFNDGELLENIKTSGSPTGLVYNYSNHYGGYKLITVTISGTIEAANIVDGNPDINTTVVSEFGGAIYTGVDLNRKRLYVCNFASGQVEMYDTTFLPIGTFTADALKNSGYAPFNVIAKGKFVYVTFARKNNNCVVSGIGFGYLVIFSRDGQLLYIFGREPLNAPWGLSFSECDKYLYIGNHGDGKINVFDICDREFIGPLLDKNCNIVQIGDLWGISLSYERLSFTSGMDNLCNCFDSVNGLIGYLEF